jgi:hypothetical protein
VIQGSPSPARAEGLSVLFFLLLITLTFLF